MDTNTLARGLGWFSIALGTWEAAGGQSLADLLGIKSTGLIRAYGARELGVGAGILASPGSVHPGWLWARLAGDGLDIATLLAALKDNPKQANVLIALAAVGGVTVADFVCAQQLTHRQSTPA